MPSCLGKFTPEEMEAEAATWQGQFRSGEPGYGKACDFIWTQVDNFPVAALEAPEEWKQFWEEEKNNPERKEYFQCMEEWWISAPDEHIVIVEGTDGKWYVWEGNHRVGIAHTHGMKTVPAFVGTRVSARAAPKL
jgi:hypothetical protein